jgi:8-oxo-dGTP pyrophosphatase MutT (NUDIX family)
MRAQLAIRRLGYRVAHRALRVYWFLFHPTTRGVKCLLTDGDRVLLVRHTYGDRRWDLPGGTVRRGENPAEAARREMAEELGVELDELIWLGALDAKVDHRNDRLNCFQAELRDPPLTLELAELSAAEWFPREELPRQLARLVRPILSRTPAESS